MWLFICALYIITEVIGKLSIKILLMKPMNYKIQMYLYVSDET